MYYSLILFCLVSYAVTASNGQNNSLYVFLPKCAALYARSAYLVHTGNSNDNITLSAFALDSASSKCDNLTSIVMTMKGPKVENLKVRLDFIEKQGFWGVANANIDLSCSSTSKACVNIAGGILKFQVDDTPLGWGYTCSDLQPAVIYNSTSATQSALKFFGLQLQVFNITGGVFGNDTVDCTGYFSIPVWSTLIVSFLLIGILTYGLAMLTSIQPNEKYDDPKAKAVVLGADN